MFRAALVTFEVSPKYTNHFEKNLSENVFAGMCLNDVTVRYGPGSSLGYVVKKRRFEPDPNSLPQLDFDLIEGITTDEKSTRMTRSNSVTKPPPQQPAE